MDTQPRPFQPRRVFVRDRASSSKDLDRNSLEIMRKEDTITVSVIVVSKLRRCSRWECHDCEKIPPRDRGNVS
jgi:hypothetical protein